MSLIFAMPPQSYRDLRVGLVVVIAMMALLVWQPVPARDERTRRWRLARLAPVGGLLLGCGLALGADWFEPVSPLDVWGRRTLFVALGLLAGLVVAAGFALSAVMARDVGGKPAKNQVDDRL